jgi:hypothetical protein
VTVGLKAKADPDRRGEGNDFAGKKERLQLRLNYDYITQAPPIPIAKAYSASIWSQSSFFELLDELD